MPIYEYYCTKCKEKFELLRKVSQLGDPAECPKCKGQASRVLSKFSSFSRDASGSTTSITGSSCSSCSSGNCSSCHN